MTTITFTNLGTVNKNVIYIDGLQFWFSYQTCVAFKDASGKIYVCENAWSVTTGKLLNELEPDKDKRYPRKAFEKMLAKVLNRITVK